MTVQFLHVRVTIALESKANKLSSVQVQSAMLKNTPHIKMHLLLLLLLAQCTPQTEWSTRTTVIPKNCLLKFTKPSALSHH